MKRILIVLMLISTATSAAAISRYSALEHSCGDIQSIIDDEGAAIFRYPSPRKTGITLYDRYVRNDMFCASHQITERVLIPSRDGDRCQVRHCITRSCDDFGGCFSR
jgi:hypothetical protein